MSLIGNMLMRFVTIADSLWTFFISSQPDWNHRGREQEVFSPEPTAPLPPSAGPRFIWIINDSLSFFFQPPPLFATQRHLGSFTCFYSSRKKWPPGMTGGLLFLRVKYDRALQAKARHADCREPGGCTKKLLCYSKLKYVRLKRTQMGLKFSLVWITVHEWKASASCFSLRTKRCWKILSCWSNSLK